MPSLAAFWVGLLYDDDALDAGWDMVKGWSAAERQKLRDDVPRLGFAAEIRGRNVLTLAQETLRFAARGLARRKYLDRNGRDETRYLRPLEESIARGLTPAEELLEKFHGALERLGRADLRGIRVLSTIIPPPALPTSYRATR